MGGGRHPAATATSAEAGARKAARQGRSAGLPGGIGPGGLNWRPLAGSDAALMAHQTRIAGQPEGWRVINRSPSRSAWASSRRSKGLQCSGRRGHAVAKAVAGLLHQLPQGGARQSWAQNPAGHEGSSPRRSDPDPRRRPSRRGSGFEAVQPHLLLGGPVQQRLQAGLQPSQAPTERPPCGGPES